MERQYTSSKRAKLSRKESHEEPTLSQLLEQKAWMAATVRALKNPHEVLEATDPSPLALACRGGAPYECICSILETDPSRLRHVLDSRGTPLHEAVVCEDIGSKVLDVLLSTDVSLGSETPRATLLQDVDGFTPLHLLIRRRFQSHILNETEDSGLMTVLEMLVKSCPEAVVIPDRGEYEEPPIIYAVKANIYAPSLDRDDETVALVEHSIFEMVRIMLHHAPSAAAQVFSGFRGQYSALHSAVFHGRYTTTIDLLLKTEEQYPADQKAALLTNTQAELPLHFCAMRGERPRTVALLAKAAPEAVLKRDVSGLTPFHWLWIRFISALLAMDEDRRGTGDSSIEIITNPSVPFETNCYNDFATIEKGEFSVDLQLIKKLDPPIDFLRMRHIPQEVSMDTNPLEWANRSEIILQRIRKRFQKTKGMVESQTWTRRDAVVCLFWTKAVSLLEASIHAAPDRPSGKQIFVHTAFASPCCVPPVAHMAASLFPEELNIRDDRGRLPIHYAASRIWHSWDWPRGDGGNEQAAARLLQRESLDVLRLAMKKTPQVAFRVTDGDNRLVLHLIIDSFVQACSQPARLVEDNPVYDMLQIVRQCVTCYPESLQRRDGNSMLYPYLQATAAASAQQQQPFMHDELPLSITYELLRQNPSVLSDY